MSEPSESAAPERRRGRKPFYSVIGMLAAIAGIGFLLNAFIVRPFVVPSPSMERTLRCDDRVLAELLTLRFDDPDRGDIIVFHPPAATGTDGRPDPAEVLEIGTTLQLLDSPLTKTLHPADEFFVKRVIGLPGETIEQREETIFVDGKAIDEPYLNPVEDAAPWGPFTVPKGTYLMLGDNRAQSGDSRLLFGPVPREFMVGRVLTIYWPWSRLGAPAQKDPSTKPARLDARGCELT